MKIVLFANTDWYLWNFRRSLAISLCKAGHDVIALSPTGDFGPRMAGQGLRWESIRMDRRSLNPIGELAVLWRLFRFVRIEKPDLLHCFTLKSVIYGGFCSKIAGVPIRVFSVDGLGYVFTSTALKARLLRPLVRFLLRVSIGEERAILIVQNDDDVAALAKMVSPNIIRKISGAGVDCSRFAPKERSATDNGAFRVLLPARLLWEKGVQEFVEASAILQAQGRQVDMLVAGNPDLGNPASVPEELLVEWSSKGLIKWLGHVADMPELLSTVHVVSLPSYREGLPTCLTEAGACGLPLITTDSPGCREAVAHEVNGLLIPPRDSNALAEAISRLQDDHALRVRLGHAARRRALDEFDEEIVIRKTLVVYGEVGGARCS